MTNENIEMWITDKNGEKHFCVICGYGWHQGELNNLKTHLLNAKNYPSAYNFLDVDTARIESDKPIDGAYRGWTEEDDELLNELMV